MGNANGTFRSQETPPATATSMSTQRSHRSPQEVTYVNESSSRSSTTTGINGNGGYGRSTRRTSKQATNLNSNNTSNDKSTSGSSEEAMQQDALTQSGTNRFRQIDQYKLVCKKLGYDMDKPKNGQVACISYVDDDGPWGSDEQTDENSVAMVDEDGGVEENSSKRWGSRRQSRSGSRGLTAPFHSRQGVKKSKRTLRRQSMSSTLSSTASPSSSSSMRKFSRSAPTLSHQSHRNMKLYQFGGTICVMSTHGITSRAFERFHFHSGRWEHLISEEAPAGTVNNVANVGGELPTERAWSRSIIVRDRFGRDRLIVFAGYNGQQVNDMFEYTFHTNSWKRVQYANPNTAMEPVNSCSIVVRGRGQSPLHYQKGYQFEPLYDDDDDVEGGDDEGTNDIDGDVDMNPSEKKVHRLSDDGIDEYDPSVNLVIFGGYHVTHINALYSFNMATRDWQPLHSETYEPHPRSGHACVMLPQYDRMVMFGGYGNGKFIGKVEEYRFDTQAWFVHENSDKATNAPNPRRGHQMDVLDSDPNIILMCGGRTESGNYVNECFLYFYLEQIWMLLDINFHNPRSMDIPAGRHNAHLLKYHVGRGLRDRSSTSFVLFAGTSNYVSILPMHSICVVDSSLHFKEGLRQQLDNQEHGPSMMSSFSDIEIVTGNQKIETCGSLA